MQTHHASIPSDVLPSSFDLFYCCFPFRGFAFKCQSNVWTAAAANSDSERPKTPEDALSRPQDGCNFFWRRPGWVLGASWGVSGASWRRCDALRKSIKNHKLYCVVGHPGAKEDVFGTSCGHLGASWGRLGVVLGLPDASGK